MPRIRSGGRRNPTQMPVENGNRAPLPGAHPLSRPARTVAAPCGSPSPWRTAGGWRARAALQKCGFAERTSCGWPRQVGAMAPPSAGNQDLLLPVGSARSRAATRQPGLPAPIAHRRARGPGPKPNCAQGSDHELPTPEPSRSLGHWNPQRGRLIGVGRLYHQPAASHCLIVPDIIPFPFRFRCSG
jgi:hypothetical protein